MAAGRWAITMLGFVQIVPGQRFRRSVPDRNANPGVPRNCHTRPGCLRRRATACGTRSAFRGGRLTSRQSDHDRQPEDGARRTREHQKPRRRLNGPCCTPTLPPAWTPLVETPTPALSVGRTGSPSTPQAASVVAATKRKTRTRIGEKPSARVGIHSIWAGRWPITSAPTAGSRQRPA